jgi:hypothetical protein
MAEAGWDWKEDLKMRRSVRRELKRAEKEVSESS